MTVVDVGANYGYFTILLGEAVGKTGHVIAVEPNPDAVSLLQESVALNGHWTQTRIVPYALAECAGRAWLFAPEGEPKNATLTTSSEMVGGTTVEVSTITLDEVALPYQKVDFVKIDAEGGEHGIVAGMRQLIARDRPTIILEFNATRYADPQALLNELIGSYGRARELGLDGVLRPLNAASVLDQRNREDRILLFG
jgi:FkbM family methyltransferase